MDAADARDLDDEEIQRFLEEIFRGSGIDFRDYARASMWRRVRARMQAERVGTLPDLLDKVLSESACMDSLVQALTVHVTSMFRDPGLYRALREQVVPLLRTYPFVRIWHAGCSTGEEVYSLAILLHEEGLGDRARIYATDMSAAVLRSAAAGVFPLSSMKENAENYIGAGGTNSFSQYYTAKYDHAIFRPRLVSHVVFAQHNLVTDSSFNEFNVILCRNVMIYFNATLQNRVHRLIFDSLAQFGVLALGRKESLRFTPHAARYDELDADEKLYRKVR
jgi:chemotaxis protein methyltransferase CheR